MQRLLKSQNLLNKKPFLISRPVFLIIVFPSQVLELPWKKHRLISQRNTQFQRYLFVLVNGPAPLLSNISYMGHLHWTLKVMGGLSLHPHQQAHPPWQACGFPPGWGQSGTEVSFISSLELWDPKLMQTSFCCQAYLKILIPEGILLSILKTEVSFIQFISVSPTLRSSREKMAGLPANSLSKER